MTADPNTRKPGDILKSAINALEGVAHTYEVLKRAAEEADRALHVTRHDLNKAQKAFDEAVETIKKNPAWSTHWYSQARERRQELQKAYSAEAPAAEEAPPPLPAVDYDTLRDARKLVEKATGLPPLPPAPITFSDESAV